MLHDVRETALGAVTRWYSDVIEMPTPALPRQSRRVHRMSALDFREALDRAEDAVTGESYLCSATLGGATAWNDCAAFPDLLERVLDDPRPVIFAECVALGDHDRVVGSSHLHDDGVLLWSPDVSEMARLRAGVQFGTFDPVPHGADLGRAWRGFLERLPGDHVDIVVTHNFNPIYDHAVRTACARHAPDRPVRVVNDATAAHFVAADSFLNLLRAVESDLRGRIVVVAAAQTLWRWCAFERIEE